MNPPFFVEIISRNEGVKYRHQVNSLPIRMGRGYDNDVILDDPHVSAHHALIEQAAEDGLVIKDLGSHNGIIYKGSRQTEMLLDGNMVFRLGQTNIRIRSADFPVDAEITDTTSYSWEGWRPALAGLIIIITLTVFNTWIDDTKKFTAIRYLSTISGMVIVGFVWCGVWSFANRLFGGNARLGRHLFILGCGIAAIEIWSLSSNIITYAFSLETLTRYGSHGVIALVAAMVFFHLLTINPNRSRHFALFCVTLAMLGSGLMLMYNFSSKGKLADELYMSERFPPLVRQSADKPITQLISDATKLKTKVDEERAKSVSVDEEDINDEGED
jgi:hypothetical protein